MELYMNADSVQFKTPKLERYFKAMHIMAMKLPYE